MALDKDWMTLPDGTRVPRPKEVITLPSEAQGDWLDPIFEGVEDWIVSHGRMGIEPIVAKRAIRKHMAEERIDELKLITKDTFEKPITPENQNDQTWQGGYNFARNSLKRYKLDRVRELQQRQPKGE